VGRGSGTITVTFVVFSSSSVVVEICSIDPDLSLIPSEMSSDFSVVVGSTTFSVVSGTTASVTAGELTTASFLSSSLLSSSLPLSSE
jgi:hypothetical protein